MFSVRYEGVHKPSTVGGTASPTFRFYVDGEPHTIVRITIAGDTGAGRLDGVSPADLERALVQFGLERVAQFVEADEVPGEYTQTAQVVEVSNDELPHLLSLLLAKTCRYQLRDSDDLYCAAASEGDETAVGHAGLHQLAPTSSALCMSCALPSTDIVCSHLMHPQVTGSRAMGGVWNRTLAGALCDLGKPGASTAAAECRPGGHDCWERELSAEPPDDTVELAPLALTEAVDFLDAVWQLRFGTPLVRRLATTPVAGVVIPVSSRDDFKARMSDLCGIIEGFEIDDALLPPADRAVTGSLNRLQRALRNVSSDAADDTIDQLRVVVKVRTALQHPGRARELHQHFEKLGIRYPPSDWGRAWEAIKSRVIPCLTQLRDEVRLALPAPG